MLRCCVRVRGRVARWIDDDVEVLLLGKEVTAVVPTAVGAVKPFAPQKKATNVATRARSAARRLAIALRLR